MALLALPNPSKEFVVNYPLDKVHAGVEAIVQSVDRYRFVQKNSVFNSYRLHVRHKDVLAKMSLDMGQHIDITISQIDESKSKINIEVSRVMGVIDVEFEAMRAKETLNDFIALFGRALEGRTNEIIDEENARRTKKESNSKTVNKIMWFIIALIIGFLIFKVIEIRQENLNRQKKPANYGSQNF